MPAFAGLHLTFESIRKMALVYIALYQQALYNHITQPSRRMPPFMKISNKWNLISLSVICIRNTFLSQKRQGIHEHRCQKYQMADAVRTLVYFAKLLDSDLINGERSLICLLVPLLYNLLTWVRWQDQWIVMLSVEFTDFILWRGPLRTVTITAVDCTWVNWKCLPP